MRVERDHEAAAGLLSECCDSLVFPVYVSPRQGRGLCLTQTCQTDELDEVAAVVGVGVVGQGADVSDDGRKFLEGRCLADRLLGLLDF